MTKYVDALVREIRATAQLTQCAPPACGRISGKVVPQEPLETVYVGGGTPSLLPPWLLGRVLTEVDSCFGIASHAEVTLEVDPATFSAHTLEELRALGFNRLSVGAQAFQDKLLLGAGRIHTVNETQKALSTIGTSSFANNWSMDLLFGLPEQHTADWAESISLAVQAAPQHIATYGLTVEPGSAWGRRGYEENVAPLPPEEHVAEMFEMVHRRLTAAGYEHYEVSNFARPRCKSQHNQVYWEGRPFYGFGVGATSCDEWLRVRRPRSIRGWNRWVDWLEARLLAIDKRFPASKPRTELGTEDAAGVAGLGLLDGPGEPVSGMEVVESQPVDAIIGGLRTAKGVSLRRLRESATKSKSTCTFGTSRGSRGDRASVERGAAALERLWPLLLQLQDQGLIELQLDHTVEETKGTEEEPGFDRIEAASICPVVVGTSRSVGRGHHRIAQTCNGWAATTVQGRVRLTAPAGYLVADEITAEIWSVLDS